MEKLLKKTFVILFIVLFLVNGFLYRSIYEFDTCYADDNTSMTDEDMVDAFLAYCRARDLTIEGSALDIVTTFTSDTYRLICNKIGLNMTAIQAEIKKVYEETISGIPAFSHYDFSSSGIYYFNQIFAQFLLDNDLEVGDEDVDEVVYSGKYYRDSDGNGCFLYIINSQGVGNNLFSPSARGTTYRYTSSQMKSLYDSGLRTISYNFGELGTFSAGLAYSSSTASHTGYFWYGSSGPHGMFFGERNNSTLRKDQALCYDTYTGALRIGIAQVEPSLGQVYAPLVVGSIEQPEDEPVTVTSPVIKEPLPDDPVGIYPDGRTTNDPEPEPEVPPGGTLPDWTIPDGSIIPDGNGGSTFDWNFQLPDLNIDWSINGLTEKFPFCIPFDIVNFCRALSADPVAPVIQGEIPIGNIYTWEVDFDLSEYNNWASLVRTVELLGFIIGLIYLTIRLVKG